MKAKVNLIEPSVDIILSETKYIKLVMSIFSELVL